MDRPGRVCILHVGGTIGMVWTAGGYVPRRGFVERYLATMVELSRSELPDWELHPLEPLLDSADMRPSDWVRIAEAVVDRYDDFDGFVVLHGTDTMVYSASALSFLLHGLGKPVVFTGAQLSLEHVRSDGREHVITSLLLAGTRAIPESSIYFGSRLLRGNRAQKVHADEFIAFSSGSWPPLARVGVEVDVDWSRVLTPSGATLRAVRLEREPTVVALRVFPGMSATLLRQVLDPRVEGLILETYGTGAFPSGDRALLDVLDRAIAQGTVIVNCSQSSGRVRQTRYGTGAALADIGVISGHDMTPQAALTKLYCLLASGATPDDARRRMGMDLAGELTPPPQNPEPA